MNWSRKIAILCLVFATIFASHHRAAGQPEPYDPFNRFSFEQVQFPFEYNHNFIIVRLRINGIPLRFLFDTGAEHTLLFKPALGELIGLQYSKRIPLRGSDVSRQIYALIARNVNIQIYPMNPTLHDILVLEEDYTALDEITGIPIDGILGSSFFRNYTVKIDFNKQVISFFKASVFEPPTGRKWESYPIQIINSKPYISALTEFTNKDSAMTTLLLDTGAGLSLLLHTNTHESILLPENTITGNLGSGLGGYLKGYVGKIDKVEMLNYTFSNVVTSFQDLDENFLKSVKLVRNGIVGNEILSRFNIIIDYPRERLYLRARKNIKDQFTYDRSGLTIFAVGLELDEFIIHDVLPGSPADRAGLKAGDQILTFQRWPSSFYNLATILSKLRKKPGKKIRMRVLRGNEKMLFTFELEELF